MSTIRIKPEDAVRLKAIAKAALVLWVAIATSACKRAEPVPPPHTSPSLSSQGRYRLTLELSEGFDYRPADQVEAIYVISNLRQCTPRDDSKALGGLWNEVVHHLDVDLMALGPNRYVTDIPANPLRDEDYYGLGVCHWVLSGVSFVFDSSRRVTVNQRHLANGKAEYLCAAYPDSPVGNCFESGTAALQSKATYQAAKIIIDKE